MGFFGGNKFNVKGR
ncbi:unnamed protein product, partial [Diplocarpon coronariae]